MRIDPHQVPFTIEVGNYVITVDMIRSSASSRVPIANELVARYCAETNISVARLLGREQSLKHERIRLIKRLHERGFSLADISFILKRSVSTLKRLCPSIRMHSSDSAQKSQTPSQPPTPPTESP